MEIGKHGMGHQRAVGLDGISNQESLPFEVWARQWAEEEKVNSTNTATLQRVFIPHIPDKFERTEIKRECTICTENVVPRVLPPQCPRICVNILHRFTASCNGSFCNASGRFVWDTLNATVVSVAFLAFERIPDLEREITQRMSVDCTIMIANGACHSKPRTCTSHYQSIDKFNETRS